MFARFKIFWEREANSFSAYHQLMIYSIIILFFIVYTPPAAWVSTDGPVSSTIVKNVPTLRPSNTWRIT